MTSENRCRDQFGKAAKEIDKVMLRHRQPNVESRAGILAGVSAKV